RADIALAIGHRLKVDSHSAVVAELSEGWTGAEIEQLLRSAARQTRRNITVEALRSAAADIKPISKVRSAEISALRDWGKANLRLANSPDPTLAGRRARTIQTPVIPSNVAEMISGGVA